MPKLVNLLAHALSEKATDIVLVPNQCANMKVDGLYHAFGEVLAASDITDAIYTVLNPLQQEDYKTVANTSMQRAYRIAPYADCPARLTLYSQREGVTAIIHMIPFLATLTDYGLQNVVNFHSHDAGLLLIGGGQGQGVTTTGAALANALGQTPGQHIVALEEVMEYPIEAKNGIVERIECNSADAYCHSLQRFITADIDVLSIDRFRDHRVMHHALCLAASGCKVIGSVAIDTPFMAIEFVVNQFPQGDRDWIKPFLLHHLVQVFCQRLTPDKPEAIAFESLPMTTAVAGFIANNNDAELHTCINRGVA